MSESSMQHYRDQVTRVAARQAQAMLTAELKRQHGTTPTVRLVKNHGICTYPTGLKAQALDFDVTAPGYHPKRLTMTIYADGHWSAR